MTLHNNVQMPISFDSAHKSDVRTQFAALCYRIVQDKPQILLITSRESKRWIVPKGWPMPGKTPGQCALREAYEEAGVVGKVSERPVGLFPYIKVMDDDTELPCVALIYPVRVNILRNDYPEADERKRKWYSRKKAANKVSEPELAQLLRTFEPKLLRM